jgi:hypothetical protein
MIADRCFSKTLFLSQDDTFCAFERKTFSGAAWLIG